MAGLTSREKSRYARHIIMKELGLEGQERLRRSTALIAGCGALGCASSDLLARAGVGKLKVLDRDVVELTNLQRQILFTDADVDRPKAEAAKEALSKANPDIQVEALLNDLSPDNAEELISGCDVVVDATDNMETRYIINDVCVKKKIPWIYGGAISTHGMTLTIIPGKTACFRCFFPVAPGPGALPTCELAGVLNTVPLAIASIQATEAIKLLVGKEEAASKELTVIDLWNNDFRRIPVPLDPNCAACKKGRFEYLERADRTTTRLCGRQAVQVNPHRKGEIKLDELSRKLSKLGSVREMPSSILFKIDGYELTIFKDGRALIKGTGDESVARALYSKYIGS